MMYLTVMISNMRGSKGDSFGTDLSGAQVALPCYSEVQPFPASVLSWHENVFSILIYKWESTIPTREEERRV